MTSTAKKLSADGVRERPIIFSAPMVRAILYGRKTVTRRVVQWPKWCQKELDRLAFALTRAPVLGRFVDGELVQQFGPYGVTGDRLWVRETWADDRGLAHYRATEPDWTVRGPNRGHWRPSIYMPRWASRLTLEVVFVRVERLQEISEEDAIAEGAFWTDYGRTCFHCWQGPGTCPAPPEHHQQRNGWSMEPTQSADECLGTARYAFANFWNKLNGSRAGASWDDSPWVWRIEFRRVGP